MIHTEKNTEPCSAFCGVPAQRGRTTPLNPMTAKDFLRCTGFMDKDCKAADPDDFIVEAMECAEHLNDGCALIRNKYLEAAKADDEDAMYSLFVDQMAVNEKPVPFIVRAIAGLRNEGLWRTFAQAVADELEFLLQAEIEEELNGLLEEDEDYVGMTE